MVQVIATKEGATHERATDRTRVCPGGAEAPMTKARIRSLSRRGSRSEKSPSIARAVRRTPGPTVCVHCGAVFHRKTWRHDHKVSLAFLDRAVWRPCPACRQARAGEGLGKVVLRGAWGAPVEAAMRRRIENVAARAAHTQPQHRLVGIERGADGLEVLTTSQKLAHRIARELQKVFGGRASYAWSDRDGALSAVWQYTATPPRRRPGRPSGGRAR
jgi:hypothetical protein